MPTAPAARPSPRAPLPDLYPDAQRTSRALRLAFLLNLLFALVELAGGLWTNSLAILSDALHDLGDSLAIGLSWLLEARSWRARDRRYSYGYRRFTLLGSLVNAFVLTLGSLFVISEAIPRLLSPVRPHAAGMVGLAVLGLVVNGAAVWNLRSGKGLNARMVAWHLLEDVLGWAAVLAVSVVLMFRDLPILDPLLSLGITGYILVNVARGLSQTLRVFLQGVPSGVDLDGIEARLRAIAGVHSTHHTHMWTLDGERHVLTSHLVVGRDATRDDLLRIKAEVNRLAASVPLEHTTIELEFEDEVCWLRTERGGGPCHQMQEGLR